MILRYLEVSSNQNFFFFHFVIKFQLTLQRTFKYETNCREVIDLTLFAISIIVCYACYFCEVNMKALRHSRRKVNKF